MNLTTGLKVPQAFAGLDPDRSISGARVTRDPGTNRFPERLRFSCIAQMPLPSSDKLGPDEILAPLGRSGLADTCVKKSLANSRGKDPRLLLYAPCIGHGGIAESHAFVEVHKL